MIEANNEYIPSSVTNDELRAQAVNEIVKETPSIKHNPIEFIKAVGKRFIEKQLDNFPNLCMVTRWQNKLKWDELNAIGNKGKYTDTYGWSPNHTMKFDYEIPQELYLFMINLVYKDFWSEDNERVWRKFMKRICDGRDPMETLLWVKKIYGPNSQEGLVLN